MHGGLVLLCGAAGALAFSALYWFLIGYIAADFWWPIHSMSWTWDGAGLARAILAFAACFGLFFSFAGAVYAATEH